MFLNQQKQKVYYFAYGSNLNKIRLFDRVGFCKLVKTAKINKHVLDFNVTNNIVNFANIRKTNNKKDFCEGVIYEMSFLQLEFLSLYEGLYKKIKLVTSDDDEVITFIAKDKYISNEIFIESKYFNIIRNAAVDLNLERTLSVLEENQTNVYFYKNSF